MEHMINFIVSTIGTICVGLLTNYIYDKLKSHSVQKNGFELDIRIKFIKK